MHRDEHGAPPGLGAEVEQRGDVVVVWREDLASPGLALLDADAAVARNGRQLADGRDRAVPLRLAIAVDDEPRIGLQHGARIERGGEMLGNARNADIPGDVAVQLGFGQAEVTEPAGDRAPGMVGCQEEIGARFRPQHANRRRIALFEELFSHFLPAVTPAGAGVQGEQPIPWPWIPACAGMTGEYRTRSLHWNDQYTSA